MRKAGFVVAFVLCYAVTAFGQQGEIPLPPPATDTIAPDIPGVVKGGTKVQVIVDGLKQTDGPAAMADGTLLYWDLMERRIGKVEPDGTASRSTARTACMRQRRRASRSSVHRASTWAPFPYRGIPTTWPSRVPTRRRSTSSAPAPRMQAARRFVKAHSRQPRRFTSCR